MLPVIADDACPIRPTGGRAIVAADCAPLAGAPPLDNDAMVQIRQLFYDGFEAGLAQSIGVSDDFRTLDDSDRAAGRYAQTLGRWEWVATGGRDGGGYLRAAAPLTTGVDHMAGQWISLKGPGDPADNGTTDLGHQVLVGPGEPVKPRWGMMHLGYNLFGKAITEDKTLMQLGRMRVELQPDLRLKLTRLDKATAFGNITRTLVVGPTSFAVPASGWWSVEWQCGLAPFPYPKGGFGLVRFYSPGTGTIGVTALKGVGISTAISDLLAWTERFDDGYTVGLWGDSGGVPGIGIDDFIIAGPYGTTKRLLLDTYIGPAWAASDLEINSDVSHSESHLTGVPALEVGGNFTHGSPDRWRNVRDTTGRTRDEVTADMWQWGKLSSFTSAWLDGPNLPGDDPETSNELHDEAPDVYGVALARPNVAAIEGVQPFILVAGRQRIAFGKTEDILGGFNIGPIFNYYGRHLDLANGVSSDWTDAHAGFAYRRLIRPLVRSGVVDVLGHPTFTRGQGWSPLLRYSIDPWSVLEQDPATLARWTPNGVRAAGVGAKGDLSFYDANDPVSPSDPAERWISVNVAQAGLEVAYHHDDIAQVPPAPTDPVLDVRIGQNGTDPNVGLLGIYDLSVDFNGTQDQVVTGIVNRVVDWGDGSPTTTIPGSGAGNLVQHTYAHWGTFTVRVTITNAIGRSLSVTQQFTTFNQAPTADFTFAADPGDPSGRTIAFTDASGDPDGVPSIVARDWDFGDGSPHATVANPTHTYAVDGVHNVTLTVTDDGGLQDPTTKPVTTPLIDNPRVNMPIVWADSMGAAGRNQSTERWDFTNGAEVLVAGGGRDGNDAVKENSTFGTWQYTFIGVDPHAFQFGFDLQGQALPAKELPLFMVGNSTIAVVLRPDGKVRVYARDGSFVFQQVLETAAAVPGTGKVVGQLRFKFGAAGVGFVRLWINGETLAADPVAVDPGGIVSMSGQPITLGTGSAGNYDYAPAGGFAAGLPNTLWFDVAAMDDSAAPTHTNSPGDVHFAIAKPQAIGTFNDTGVVAASDLQSDDQGTTATTFTATGQKDTFTVNTPTLVGVPTILSVLPYYEGFRGGTVGSTRQRALLVKSGATLAQSQTISAASQWTARFHVIPADGADKWVLPNDPATAAPWANAAAIGATEVGMLAVAISSSGTILLSQLGYEVAYWNT